MNFITSGENRKAFDFDLNPVLPDAVETKQYFGLTLRDLGTKV